MTHFLSDETIGFSLATSNMTGPARGARYCGSTHILPDGTTGLSLVTAKRMEPARRYSPAVG